MLSVVNEMTREKQRNDALFSLLIESLSGLSKIDDVLKSIFIFEIKLLKILGYEPNFKKCSECNKEISGAEANFSVSRSGVVCNKCSEIWDNLISISAGTIKSLEKMLHWNINESAKLKLSKSFIEEIKKILYPSIRYHLGKEIKARKFLEKPYLNIWGNNNEITETVS